MNTEIWEPPHSDAFTADDHVRILRRKVEEQGDELARAARREEFLRAQNHLLLGFKRVVDALLLNRDEEDDVLRDRFRPEVQRLAGDYFRWVVEMRAKGHIVSN